MNKILFKVFDTATKGFYGYIFERFSIDTADKFIRKRQDKFINKFCASDNLHRVSKNCAFLFLSERRQISMDFNKFW